MYRLLSIIIGLALFSCMTAPAHAQLVRVSGMSDFAFGSWSGSGDMTLTDTVCIYRSSGGTSYRATATGSGTGGAFALANGGNQLVYRVRWRQVAGTYTTLTAGSASTFNGASTQVSCGGSDNAELEIFLQSTNLEAAPSGAYSGTLSILIEPN